MLEERMLNSQLSIWFRLIAKQLKATLETIQLIKSLQETLNEVDLLALVVYQWLNSLQQAVAAALRGS